MKKSLSIAELERMTDLQVAAAFYDGLSLENREKLAQMSGHHLAERLAELVDMYKDGAQLSGRKPFEDYVTFDEFFEWSLQVGQL